MPKLPVWLVPLDLGPFRLVHPKLLRDLFEAAALADEVERQLVALVERASHLQDSGVDLARQLIAFTSSSCRILPRDDSFSLITTGTGIARGNAEEPERGCRPAR